MIGKERLNATNLSHEPAVCVLMCGCAIQMQRSSLQDIDQKRTGEKLEEKEKGMLNGCQ